MKNKFVLFNMLILIALTASRLYSQNRNVVWVHGFTGNEEAWEHYADIFTNERKISSLRKSYKTTLGLDTAANQLNRSIQMHLANPTNSSNLGIGHSMGGVMIRELDRRVTPKKFGGFITLTSPNKGAPVSQSILDGQVNSAGIKAVAQLSAGPAAEFTPFPFYLTTIGSVAITVKFIADTFTDALMMYIGDSDNLLSPATNQDLKPGSAAMNALNNYTSTTHKISIIAEENSPVHWRLIGSLRGNEADWVNNMAIVREVYNVKFVYHTAMAILNPFAPSHSVNALAWKLGRDWIDDSESIWCSLIKTKQTTSYTYTVLEWFPCKPPIRSPMSINPLNIPMPCDIWVETTYTYYVTTNYPSDGLLPTYAQELNVNPVGSPNRYTINYANHMEVRDMEHSKLPNGQPNDGTKNTLNAIFNRADWFNTEENP